MKIAIVTGASSGLGKEFAKQLHAEFPDVEEIWLIARRKERLEELSNELDVECKCIGLDLTQNSSYESLIALLSGGQPDVRVLINCCGVGKLGDIAEVDYKYQVNMVDLNVKAMTALTSIVLPHMTEGAKIINVSSIAAFMAIPRMTVYGATKSFVKSYTRGLNIELKPRKICVTAVCPGPMDTEFLDVAEINGNSKLFKDLPRCSPESVVKGTLKAAKKNKCIYTNRFVYKALRVLSKILPEPLLSHFSKA